MRIPIRKPGNLPTPQFDPTVTKEKFAEWQKKVKNMLARRPALAEEVSRLSLFGDFSENAEYQHAKGRLRGLNQRILELQKQIDHARIIEIPKSTDRVCVGHKVEVEMNGERKVFQILGAVETNPSSGVISRNSPLGEALLGARIGEEVSLAVGRNTKKIKILAIE